jgi:cation transport ATPase
VPALGYGPCSAAVEASLESEPGVLRALALPSSRAVEIDYVAGVATIDRLRGAAGRAGLEADHPESSRDAAPRLRSDIRSAGITIVANAAAAIAATVIALPAIAPSLAGAMPALAPRATEWLLAAIVIALVALAIRSWMIPAIRMWLRGVPEPEGLMALAILTSAAGALASSGQGMLRGWQSEIGFLAYPSILWMLTAASVSRWLQLRLKPERTGRPPSIDLLSRKLAVLSVCAAVAAFVIWYVFGPEPDFRNGLTALVSVLAAGGVSLAGPAAFLTLSSAIGRIRAAGFGARSPSLLADLARINLVSLDLQGTLTRGDYRISEYVLIGGMEPKELLRIASTLARGSNDPVLRALAANAPTPFPLLAERIEEHHGITGKVDGVPCMLGRPQWMRMNGVALEDLTEDLERFAEEAKSVRIVCTDRVARGALAFRNELSEEAGGAVARLRRAGIAMHAVSSDETAAAEAIARRFDIEGVFGDGTRASQRAELSRLRREGNRIALVSRRDTGELSLAADLAIGLGDSPAAALQVESEALEPVAVVFEASRDASSGVRRAQRFAIGWHLIALPIAAFPAIVAWPALAAAAAAGALAFSLWRACRAHGAKP